MSLYYSKKYSGVPGISWSTNIKVIGMTNLMPSWKARMIFGIQIAHDRLSKAVVSQCLLATRSLWYEISVVASQVSNELILNGFEVFSVQ
jgi:hypothetical protein